MSDETEWDFLVTWHIEDYSFCRQEPGIELKSPTFTVTALDDTEWYLSIYPGGYNEESKNYISAYVNKCEGNKSDKSHTIEYEFYFKNGHNKLSKINRFSAPFRNGRQLGLSGFVTSEEVLRKLKDCSSDILSMHCTMKKMDDKTKLSTVKREIQTRVLSDKCTFEWKVNFADFLHTLKNKTFFFLGARFYQISLNFLKEEIVIIVQQLEENSTCSGEIIGEVALMDSGGYVAFSKSSVFSFKSHEETWTFPLLVTKSRILDNIREYIVHDEIVFLCKFFLKKETKSSTPLNSIRNTFFDFKNILELRRDFQILFNEKVNTDITLRVSDGVEVQTHRAVLIARSPVFSAMFNQDMLENRTGIIDIPADVDLNTLTSFLEFLHTGAIDHMDWEKASKLLVMADKYQVSSLKEECSQYLMDTLTVDNICEILVLAEMITHVHLKKACVVYAADHAASIFSSSDRSNWIKNNPKLCADLLIYLGNINK